MPLFCYLSKDYKDYEYFQRYCHIVENFKGQGCDKIDFEIQGKELIEHLERNKDYILDGNQERVDWVQNNGKNFRTYLNTLKLVYVIFVCENKDMKNISWEEFCVVCEKINELKASYLDSIFN